jgi:hypothetical protein
LTSGFINTWGELLKVAEEIVKERNKDSSDDGDLFYHFVSLYPFSENFKADFAFCIRRRKRKGSRRWLSTL